MPESFNPAEAEAAKFNARRSVEKEQITLLPGSAAEVVNRKIQGASKLSDLVKKIRDCMALDEVQEGVGPISDLADEVESLDGKFDPKFGHLNLSVPEGYIQQQVTKMHVLTDGDFLVVGIMRKVNGNEDGSHDHAIYVEKFNAEGKLDQSFGNSGFAVVDFTKSGGTKLNDYLGNGTFSDVVLSTGDLVIVGQETKTETNGSQIFALSINSKGENKSSFPDGKGKLVKEIPLGQLNIESIYLDYETICVGGFSWLYGNPMSFAIKIDLRGWKFREKFEAGREILLVPSSNSYGGFAYIYGSNKDFIGGQLIGENFVLFPFGEKYRSTKNLGENVAIKIPISIYMPNKVEIISGSVINYLVVLSSTYSDNNILKMKMAVVVLGKYWPQSD